MNKVNPARLQPLRIPTGWSVVLNNLHDIDPVAIEQVDDERWKHLDEDLLALRHEHFGIAVDVGWYPAMSPEGQYRAHVISKDDWEMPLSTLKTRSLHELITWVERQLLEAHVHVGGTGKTARLRAPR
jgi:membrane carboxypeptidase/penicillin-binding protein